jgi:hypothetical protein
MDKPEKIRSRPDVIIFRGKWIPTPPEDRRKYKRMHVLEAEARRRRLLLLGTAILAVLSLGLVIGRYLVQ